MAKQLKMEQVACGVCASQSGEPFAHGKDFEYRTSDDTFQMVRCTECSNVYLNPRPAVEELSVIYPANYYSYNYDTAINPIALKAKDILDARKVKAWLKHVPTKQPQFLDIGCGNGRYLEMLHKLGVDKSKLYGVELSEPGIEALKCQGYQAFYGRIEDVYEQLPENSFDLIVMLQVLEHVDNPAEVVRCLSKLLKPGGALIIETPNTESIDVMLFKSSYWGGYHFPRHWNLLNQATLTRVAESNGLKIKTFNFLPAHSFWIFSLHHMIEDSWHQDWLAHFFNPCQNLLLLSFFTGLDMVRAKCGFKTSNIQSVAIKPVLSN